MLTLTLPEEENYDEVKNEFYTYPKVTLKLEHSLLSLSKWEQIYKKPFLTDGEKTPEETINYIRCMMIGPEANDPIVIRRLKNSPKIMDRIQKYIEDPMCATTIQNDGKGKQRREIITAEVIYYDMIALQIPLELEKWHLNRLLTLIQVCSIKNEPSKNSKMSMNDVYAKQEAINKANKARIAAMKAKK
jgi:hypothetical protein